MTFKKSLRNESNNVCSDESSVFDYVGNADNLSDATSLLSQFKPEVVIIELSKNDNTRLGSIKKMLAIDPKIKILATSNNEELSLGIQALLHGASSFLRSPYSNEQLSKALETTSTELLL